MIHRTKMPSLEQVYELFDDPRYHEAKALDYEAYNAMANRLHRFHLNPETWPNSPLKKASLTGFHATAKHIAAKAVSPSSETMRTI